jgi:uncharacterized Zn-binding protein involved in type VI secretion
MKTDRAWLAAMCLLPLPFFAQGPDVITMDQEPHHHLTTHNDYVKVFNVVVSPGDSIVLHRHDQDTIAIAIGDQLVTVGIPGKPDVHQKNTDAQVRLQRGGYVHSTRVDGDTPYHTVAVELMQPQTNFHNLCAEILLGQPLNCPSQAETGSAAYSSQPLLASNETEVRLLRIHPHQSMKVHGATSPQLLAALDRVSIPAIELALNPGDYNWADNSTIANGGEYRNGGDRDARLIEFLFPGAH